MALAHALTAKAPAIVLVDLALAILAYWTGVVPTVAVNAVAVATAIAAFCVILLGSRTIPYRTREDLGYSKNWPAAATGNMLFHGYPDGGYGLALACLVGLFLSGGEPQNRIVAAALLLSVAWSFINRAWPAKDESA